MVNSVDKNQNQESAKKQNPDDNKPVETMFGKTRAELEQELIEEHGEEWVRANKEMLDAQWDYIQSL